jgi:hypothetical protein
MALDDSQYSSNNEIPYDESSPEGQIVRSSINYILEAKYAKRDRMLLNKLNFDTYHLKQDYSHKKTGQSKEFLAKQALSVEQIAQFIQQSLVDNGDWAHVESEPGVENPKIKPGEMTLLTMRQLEKTDFYAKVIDIIKLGLLGGIMVVKVHGKYVTKPRYYTQFSEVTGKKSLMRDDSRKAWQLEVSLVRHEDWYPDPTGRGLYEAQAIEMDIAEVEALSIGPDAIFDPRVVDSCRADFADYEQVAKKSRETNQNLTQTSYRKRVNIKEFWGTLINSSDGRVICENSVWAIANDRYLIRHPTPNPFWHQQSPFVAGHLLSTPFAVWHKALMDAPTRHNIALNELYNLILDSGMMAIHGIKQLRMDWIADENQVADGIPPGTTLEVNSQCPPGEKVLERVDTASMAPEANQVYQLTNSEFQQAALTNDLRLGVLPSRQVKATEVVEMNQSITSVFSGIAKMVEINFLEIVLDKSWKTIAQHQNDLDQREVQNLITKERAREIAAMSPDEVFAETVDGHHFKVYGITKILNKLKDFRKLQSFLQTISGSEVLIESFIKEYSFTNFLHEIMESLDIDTDKLKLSAEEQALNQIGQQAAQGGQPGGPGAQQQGSGPNNQSQIPQASTGPLNQSVQSTQQFPPQAMAAMNRGQ